MTLECGSIEKSSAAATLRWTSAMDIGIAPALSK
jgi:hypothetical protein